MISILLIALLVPPIVAAAAALSIKPYHRLAGWIGVGCAVASSVAAAGLSWTMLTAAPDPVVIAGPFRIDALSALLALAIAFVTLLSAALSPGLSHGEADDASRTRRLRVYMPAFAGTMIAAVTVHNVAWMWVAIEATTICSALVIPLTRTKASVEASWKYLLVCSVGIALAFTGTILAYFDFVATAGDTADALNWTALRDAAASLHPPLLQLAFAFIVVGYGTKAGLAPMHTWLPDAHAEAPPPISAMMSGVLLAVAMYAIARWKAVVDAAVDPAFTNGMLIGFGLLSVFIGVFSLVIQRHYKRMLAYSSVEHMGLVAIGLGLGPLGAFAAWLHVINHAVAKSTGFLAAGRILHRYETTEIARVSGLLRTMPWTGALFATAMLALVGLPPFGLFVSEFLLIQAAIAHGQLWLATVVLLLLLAAFVSLVNHLNRMLYGDAPEGVTAGEPTTWPVIVLLAPAVILVLLGTVLPASISALVRGSAALLIP